MSTLAIQALDTLREHHSFHEAPQQDMNGQSTRRPVDLSQLSLQNTNEAQVGIPAMHQVPVLSLEELSAEQCSRASPCSGNAVQSLSSALQTGLHSTEPGNGASRSL